MSFLHLYAAQGGSAAYLSQPTLTGRFLISSHCQPEHLRRLLPRWPEMRGRLKWKDVERKRKGWRERRGQGWEEDSDEGEEMQHWYLHCDMIPPSTLLVIFHKFNTSGGQTDLWNWWGLKERISIGHSPHWSWRSRHLGSWIPDKDRRSLVMLS